MAAGYAAALLSLFLTALTLSTYRFGSRDKAVSSADSDRNLTVYAMAVGQGDGNIIVCPNGRDILIVDMGARGSQFTNKSYGAYLLKEKFKVVENQMNIHIVITHPDSDHFNFLPESIDAKLLRQVKQIVIGGNYSEYVNNFRKWISSMENVPPIYSVNNGVECFGNSKCKWTPVKNSLDISVNQRLIDEVSITSGADPWQFCGNDVNITVLGANICIHPVNASNCIYDGHNERSIVMKLAYKEWSLFLSGDFEGVRQQNRLLKHWDGSREPSILQSTYYKVSHHGAWREGKKANLMELLKAIRPKRAYVSQGHPIITKHFHPKCAVIDNLISLDSIERVKAGPEESAIICWQDETKTKGDLELRCGYAIYETCRDYNFTSKKQTCRDIKISTNGYDDHTSYVNVPSSFVLNSTAKPKLHCPGGRNLKSVSYSHFACMQRILSHCGNTTSV